MLVFLLLNLIALCIFLIMPKKLHPIQMVGAWLIAVIYHDEWLTIVSVNLHLVETTRHTGTALVIGLNRVLLYPLCSLFFLELYERARILWEVGAVFVLGISISLLIQYANEWCGLYTHRGWMAWWSILVWGGCSLLLVVTNKWFMSLLKKAEWE